MTIAALHFVYENRSEPAACLRAGRRLFPGDLKAKPTKKGH